MKFMTSKPRYQFTSTDIVAIVFIIGGLLVKLKGGDGMVTAFITLIAGYYFGHKREFEKQKNNENTTITNN